MSDKVLVEAVDLVKNFDVANFFGKKAHGVVHAVSDVSLKIFEGETFSLVGESGCGKSTLGRLLLDLIPPTSGSVLFEGTDLTKLGQNDLRKMRQKMQIIFQDPYASLNPRMKVFDIIAEPLRTHKVFKTKQELENRVKELMDTVGIRPEAASRYPHQFSGGQRQRIGIARAIALNPRFIVCDEPVSALDVSIQSQILNLLCDLQKQKGLTYLFISHDLGVVRYISSRVCVMFLGKICEIGNSEEIYTRPLHPYTKFLIDAVPQPDPTLRNKERTLLTGEIPSPVNPPSGCRFHTRCPFADKMCAEKEPELREFDGRLVACHFPGKFTK
ncbi:MAG TPA: dipeptide ABC transporter ATP-binding protein [Caproiciproducens sp.]|nr:dipeptide ABC transporter ATP-binding protein [Caproiciproducens sp.]